MGILSPRYLIQSHRWKWPHETRGAEDGFSAVALACATLAPEQSAYIYRGEAVVAECHCKGVGRYVWTLTADGMIWEAWHALPPGHTLADGSIRPSGV